MKRKMLIICSLLLLISLLFPSSTALSQNDGLSDLLVSTIWQLHLREGLGLNSADSLIAFRNSTQVLFDNAILEFNSDSAYIPGGVDDDEKDPFNAIPLMTERANILEDLDERIALARQKEQNAKDDAHARNVLFVIHAVLMDGADSVNDNTPAESDPASDFRRLLPFIHQDARQTAADLFYGHIASRIPDSGAFISSSSPSQTYYVEGEPSLPAPPDISQDSIANDGNGGSGEINIQKPLQFANGGLYDATVLVFSYTPADGVTAGMSGASTVVFRGSNPSANLSLPIGTYVFCYYWDLGTDADKDGYVDYAHKNTGSVTLTAQSTDNTNSAQVVMLDPDNNQNGKCGEAASLPSENTLSLTPQELANQGVHIYQISCTHDVLSYDSVVSTIKFAIGGVEATFEGQDTYFYQKVDVNTYDITEENANQYNYIKRTFTDTGFTYDYVLEGAFSGTGTCIALRR